jgi:hypothetical protein
MFKLKKNFVTIDILASLLKEKLIIVLFFAWAWTAMKINCN